MRTYATFAKSLRAVLQTAIAFLFTVLTKLFLLTLYRLVFNGYYEFCLMECLWAQKKGYNALYICLNRTRILLILGILLFKFCCYLKAFVYHLAYNSAQDTQDH